MSVSSSTPSHPYRRILTALVGALVIVFLAGSTPALGGPTVYPTGHGDREAPLAQDHAGDESTDHEHASTGEHQDDGHEHASEGGAHDDAEPHDHSAHGGSSEGGLRAWIMWVGKLHPMWVHFPIALLVAATLAELLSLKTGDSRFGFAARFSLWAGTLGALSAVPLGWADALGVVDEYTGFKAQLLFYHRWVGTSTAVVALVALVLCERYHRGSGGAASLLRYRVALLLGTLLVMVAGHLGGSLVFGWDYLSL